MFIIILGLVCFFLIFFSFIIYLIYSKFHYIHTNEIQFNKEIDIYKKKIDILGQDKEKLIATNASLKKEIELLKETQKQNSNFIDQTKNNLKNEFKNLAHMILDEKTEKFSKYNQKTIETLLNPFNQQLKNFQGIIYNFNKDHISINSALKQEIKTLNEQNLKISNDAQSLTNALKGNNQIQGNWGEVILRKLLESSGLREGVEFFMQKSFHTQDGKRLRPDVILKLPDNKNFIIDSKVSIIDYEKYVNSEDEKGKAMYIKKHIQSIKNHIIGLSNKNYQSIYQLESIDFVLMFVPIEPALNIVLQKDPTLYSQSYDKNIVLVSPNSLFATLRTISSIWKNEYQHRNVQEIARLGGSLHDKFVGFLTDFKKIQTRIKSVEEAYLGAENKLCDGRDNLINKSQKLKFLGAKTTKVIPENFIKEDKKFYQENILSEKKKTF